MAKPLKSSEACSLEDIDVTSELLRRPARQPDHQAENRALIAMTRHMAAPHSILQKLADTALELCQADASGISILETEGSHSIFRWHAVAGKFAPYLGGTTPRDFSPCGVVLDRNSFQLMADPVRLFPYIAELTPHVAELLLIPFYQGDTAVGTIWVVAQEQGRRFDAEDLRIMTSLSEFASDAVRVLSNLDAIQKTDTLLKAQSVALQEADQRKDEFLAMLAHELRNPLAAIGNAAILMSMSKQQDVIDYSIDAIRRQANNLSRLIDDLLDVSRINLGKTELHRETLDLAVILDSAAHTVKPLLDERKHTLTLTMDRESIWVDGDPTRLEQIFINLLNNAAKYSENGGQIWLSTAHEHRTVVIRVKDAGVGITPERLPEIFELYSQVDRSSARSEGGLGIGLTIVKKLVEMHGGSIDASSEGLGKGSEFVVRLPVVEQPASVIPPAKGPEPALRKTRILVVDDNVDTVRGMARLLKLTGHDVATAQSGLEAIESAKVHRPELILLDIGLPGMDGYEVVKRLRQEADSKDAVIVAASGYGQAEDRRRTEEAGFDYHLVKPIDFHALKAILSKLAGG